MSYMRCRVGLLIEHEAKLSFITQDPHTEHHVLSIYYIARLY